MSKIFLSLACNDYDRHLPLISGEVVPEGVDLNVLLMSPEEAFFRMIRHHEFDAAEMSLSSYILSLEYDDPEFIAIPVFPSRHFRHGSIFVSAKSGIKKPQDLISKRVGVPEYQITAAVWIRGILSDAYNVPVESYMHLTGGVEQAGRIEKLPLKLPKQIHVEKIPPDKNLSQMLLAGEIDALFSARAPSVFNSHPEQIRRLFENYAETEQSYYRKSGIFPIMHTIVIKQEIYRQNRWIAQSLLKAFQKSQQMALDRLVRTGSHTVMHPWLSSEIEKLQALMGRNWWPMGLEANRHTLDAFLAYHHEQGISKKRFNVEELFAPETLDAHML
jgi:4,5-dihydroxyphthalate decarboxylase